MIKFACMYKNINSLLKLTEWNKFYLRFIIKTEVNDDILVTTRNLDKVSYTSDSN